MMFFCAAACSSTLGRWKSVQGTLLVLVEPVAYVSQTLADRVPDIHATEASQPHAGGMCAFRICTIWRVSQEIVAQQCLLGHAKVWTAGKGQQHCSACVLAVVQ